MTDTRKRTVAVFDFDGTLTTRDTLLMFIRYAVGTRRYVAGMLIFAPLILMMLLKLYDNSRCKERVMTWFFAGMEQKEFEELGRRFASKVKSVARYDTTNALARLVNDRATVYVISASARAWVEPYCRLLGVTGVMATEMEVDSDGRLTGRFASANCYGAEKVRRLLQVEPDRDAYRLLVYGDSSGDEEMFALSDEHFKV